jgi:hypothetical protein
MGKNTARVSKHQISHEVRTMQTPRVRVTKRRMLVALALLFVSGALTDIFRNHRRVVRLHAAWAYDTQNRECIRLAQAYSREAVRQEQEAQHWPAESAQRKTRLEAAAFNNSQREGVMQVAIAARAMARNLRRLARVEQ